MLTIWLTGEEAAAHHYSDAAMHIDAGMSFLIIPAPTSCHGPSLEETQPLKYPSSDQVQIKQHHQYPSTD